MSDTDILASRILIIDDEPVNVELLEQILLREGFEQILSTTQPDRALEIYQRFQPHAVLLDLRMPRVDGFSLLSAFREQQLAHQFVPIVVLTADVTREARHKALAMGANDFLTKPFDTIEVVLRLWNLLETSVVYRRLHALNPAAAGVLPRPQLDD
jgi:DNA-binding response OmpR family regulator